MKTLSKRNRILSGVIGAVVIIVIVGLSLGLSGNLALQGTSGPYLFPIVATCLLPNGTGTVTLENYSGLMDPKWTISDGSLAKILSHGSNGATLQAYNNLGQTSIKATGSFGRTLGTTGVVVRQVCPPEIHMYVGTSVQLKTSLTGGQWISKEPDYVTVEPNGTVRGKASTGWTRVTVFYYIPGKGVTDLTVLVMVCDQGTSCPAGGYSW